jgi:GTP-binding protein
MAAYPRVKFLQSANAPAQFVPDEGREVAFAGRSNSGKSSAINVIVQRRDLARTSKTPGRTQLINFFELDPALRLVDLPGYGFAKVPRPMQDHWRGLLTAYFRDRGSLAGLFVIVDARRGLRDTDWQMMGFVETRGCPVHVLLTKADKLGRGEATQVLRETRAAVGTRASVQLFSAQDGQGLDAARRALKAMLAGRKPEAGEA